MGLQVQDECGEFWVQGEVEVAGSGVLGSGAASFSHAAGPCCRP